VLDTNCGDPIVGSIQTNVESEVYDILACWGSPNGANGGISISHACDNNNKRQSSSVLTTQVDLSGPYAGREATLVAENFPGNATVDGVDVRLDEATTDGADEDDGGLSGGAIAGIVIGSLIAVALVLAAAFLIVTRQQLPESV